MHAAFSVKFKRAVFDGESIRVRRAIDGELALCLCYGLILMHTCIFKRMKLCRFFAPTFLHDFVGQQTVLRLRET
jgi:hypothetical protein